MTNTKQSFAFLAVLLLTGSILTVRAQGPLAPAGAPAPTMKTLAQVEPRTPISALPYTITQPGSYYLTTNLTAAGGQDGVLIQADNVTLDLAGFALAGGGNNGCLVSGPRQGIAILNGVVRGWAAAGVDASSARQVHCAGLRISNNGGDGLNAGSDALVESCTALGNGGAGILVQDHSRVVGCISGGNDTGFQTVGSGNRLENNQAGTNTTHGFQLDGSQNLLVRNIARGNGVNFNIGPQNLYGQILVNAVGVLSNSNPWLNFEFRPCGPEVCNGVDDNCDGQIDENLTITCYTGPNGTLGVGVCVSGTQNCVNGQMGSCEGEITPSAEVCNGLDDDCNGAVDDGNPGAGQPCNTGLPGACAPGTTACNGGAVVCVQNAQPSTEICNGVDDDCDGVVDDGNPGGGGACNTGMLGVCQAGTLTCMNGAPTCVPNVQPSPEVCNGLDDNCNGTVDEGNPGGGGACNTGLQGVCAAGTLVCQSGALNCVQNVSPSTEVCDGLDNDCNGQVDDNCLNLESEPNNTAPQANNFGAAPRTYSGSINPVGDQDYFAFAIATTSDVRVETFDGSGSTCSVSTDTVIRLYAPDGTTLLITDDEDGINSCSLLNPVTDAAVRGLAAGTYFVRVEDFGNNSTIPAYQLKVTLTAICGNGIVEGFETCDDGNTVGGDSCPETCH